MKRLRPFVAGEHVFDVLLNPEGKPGDRGNAAFAAICRDVLGARSACLLPMGGLASLIEGPLTFPEGLQPPAGVGEMLGSSSSPDVTGLPLDPARCGGAVWAVPLWGARGQIGVLSLGEKEDGGLYSEEEMEIARASGERLLDAIAGANLARRLMWLQRQRLIEAQVLDQQSRRSLHDDVLPTLHGAILTLSGRPGDEGSTREAVAQLAEVHKRISALIRDMPSGTASRVNDLGLMEALRHMAKSEFSSYFDDITWRVHPEAEERCRAIPAWKADVLFYAAKEAVRNSARHGRAEDSRRALHLQIRAGWRDGLELVIEDDGSGSAIRSKPGRQGGQGLALHSTMLAVIGGSLAVEMKPGAGTSVTLSLPQQARADDAAPLPPSSPPAS